MKRLFNFPLIKRFISIKSEKVSIRHRIIGVVMGSCIATLIICLFFSLLVIMVERALFIKNGRVIGERTTEVSSEAILQQSVTQSCDYISAQAELLNAYLVDIQNSLIIVGDFATEIYRNPQSFVPVNVPRFSEVPAGVFSEHYTLDVGVTMNSALRRELALLGNIKHNIKSMIAMHPEIETMYITTESGLSIDFDDQAHTKQMVEDSDSVMRERPWYLIAKEKGKAAITDLYEDTAGRGYCFTFCVPFYGKGGKFEGVIGADISMVELSSIISNLSGKDIEFAMLVSTEGILATSHHKDTTVFTELPFFFDEIFTKRNDAIWNEVPDFTAATPTTHEAYIIWDTLDLTDWKLVGFAPITSIIAPAKQISEYITQNTEQFLQKAILWVDIIQFVNIFIFIVLVVIFLSFARKTANRIVAPIVKLTTDAQKIGSRDLEFLPSSNTGDEIEVLTKKINSMISDIKQITDEKQRIGAELEVARHVQASMLPNIFPPFPHRPEFDIFGYMLPAKEVGGDFYDFFFIDDTRLAIVIADVSGKGVPASLFMVITKTLIKNIAQYTHSPCDIFETVNNMLCENNDEGMFVTAFMGIYDMEIETLTYVNAGHNPPIKKHKNGTLELLRNKTTLVLAAVKDTKYYQNDISLEQGDMLYLYTDGVIDAINKHDQMFTEKRLMQTIGKFHSDNPKEVADNLINEIDRFTEGVDQADDITLLVLRVN